MSKMLKELTQLYQKLGIQEAPKGTVLHSIHHGLRRAVRRLKPQGRPAFAALAKQGFVVAIQISGGIGDHIEAARFIRDLLAFAGDFRFDIYSARPEVVRWIFSTFPQFNTCYDEYYAIDGGAVEYYPLMLWIHSFVSVHTDRMEWEKIGQQNRKLLAVCEAIESFRPKIDLPLKLHPKLDGYLAEIAMLHDMNRHNFLHGTAQIAYGGHRLNLPSDPLTMVKLNLQKKKYLTIHNGFDADTHIANSDGTKSTKSYPHFGAVAAILRQRFPEFAIVQLGVRTSEPIPGISLNLINKTSLVETAEIIRNSMLHIDNESGLVHLAACFGVKSCVVFGPTPLKYFAYEDNINIRPNFCGECWWVKPDWLKKCVRGFENARCLYLQPPESVADAIITYLKNQSAISEHSTIGRIASIAM